MRCLGFESARQIVDYQEVLRLPRHTRGGRKAQTVNEKRPLYEAFLRTPRLGLEPRTYRLTAGRSTIELSGIVGCHAAGLGAAPGRPRARDSPKLVQTRPNFVRASRNSITLPLSVNSGSRSTLAARGSRSFLDRTALGPACEKEDALATKGPDLRSEESACGQRVRPAIRQVSRLGLAI